MTSNTPSGARAGSRRFWVTVLVFALLNAATWVGYHQWNQSRLHLLRVEKFEPGSGAQVGARPVLYWQFNLDVAPESPTAPPPGVITPTVAGEWQWRDGHTLTFTPAVDLPGATRFTVSLLADRLRTREGVRLARTFTESVQTAPLDLRDIRQAAFDETDRLVLEFTFNDRVIPADVAAHLKINDADGRPVSFKTHGEAAGSTVRVITDPVPALVKRVDDAWVNIDLSAGLAGAAGPLGIAHPLSRKLAVSTSLQATSLGVYMPSTGDPELRLRLNNRADMDTVRSVLSVEPAIPFTVADSGERSEIRLRGNFKCGQRYAVKIAEAAAGIDRKKLPRAGVLSVLVPDRRANVWFEHSEGYLGTGGNRTILAKAVNLYELRAVVTRVYDDNLVRWRNAGGELGSQLADDFGRPIATRRIELPNRKNTTQDIRLSLDELLPADAPRDGVYRLSLVDDSHTGAPGVSNDRLLSDESAEPFASEPYNTAHCVVTLSDIGLSARQSKEGMLVWAVSMSGGKPLPGVRVRVFSNKNQPMGEGKTDTDGLARVTILRPPAGEQPTVILAEIPQLGHLVELDEAAPAAAKVALQRGLTWLDLRGGSINTAQFETGGRPFLRQGFEAFIYSDRGVYRPGEKVYLHAIVRGADQATPSSFPVRWQLRRPDFHDWKAQTVALDADGGALMEVDLPADVPTGRWSADLAIPGENGKPQRSFGSVSFQVEEFIPNRLKVALTVEGTKPGTKAGDRVSLVTGPLKAHVQADYLFGRPVTELPANLTARVEPVMFVATQWNGWSFGDTAHVLESLGRKSPTAGRVELEPQELSNQGHAIWELDAEAILSELNSATDAEAGRTHPARKTKATGSARVAAHREAAALGAISPTSDLRPYAGPWRVAFAASVSEAGGRAVSTGRSVNIDLVPYYVGVRPKGASVIPRTPAAFELTLVAPDGSVAAEETELSATLYRESWNTTLVEERGRYHYDSTLRLEPVGKPQKVSITNGTAHVDVIPTVSGSYTLLVSDARTGGVTTHRFFASQGAWEENVSRENPEKLELIVLPESPQGLAAINARWHLLISRSTSELWHHGVAFPPPPAAGAIQFKPGERAQVIVRSPFAGQLLLTVETDHVVSSQVVTMTASTMTVPVEISSDCRPNGYVTATVIRAIDPNAKWQTHRAYGIAPVSLDNSDRKLTLDIAAPRQVRPGQSLGVQVRVTDAAGNPAANTAVTIAAVDEGILVLTNFHTPDPFAFFTNKRALGVSWADLYSALMPEIPLPGRNSEVGGDGDADPAATHQTPVSAHRVRPVALVSGVLHTDAAGVAHTDFPVPEFSGQLRIMAVAYGNKTTGSAESHTFVRSPLLVQSSWPRFAAPTDSFSVPLVIFNNTSGDGTAEVSLQLLGDDGHPNALAFKNASGNQLALLPISIRAGGQGTASVDIVARNTVGVARVRLTAKLGGEMYQETLELPVRPASPFVTSGGYMAVKASSATTLPAQPDMLDGTRELQLRISNRPTLELPTGLEYLERYPYGCAEQTISTSFPLIALGDIGKEIAPGVFEPTRVKEKLATGITRLIGMQTADGGIAMWPGDRQAWPWVSIYAAHFVVEAQAAGHAVPEDFRDHLFAYVRNQLNRSEDGGDGLEQQAYAAYVLALAGKPERAVMSRLSELVSHPSPAASDHPSVTGQTRFHLAAAWLAAGRRDLAGVLIPAAIPQPRATRQLTGNVGSPVRERAIIASALISIDPENAALPAMIQELADAGSRHQWANTQDAAFAVMAIGKYLRQSKQYVSYDVARLLHDSQEVARAEGGASLMWSTKAATKGLSVAVAGPPESRAQLSWLQSGVPLVAPPDADSGMSVRRRYLDKNGEPLKETVRSGDLVQVELTVSALTPLDNLVIDDLLPAGLEIENGRLETTAKADTVASAVKNAVPQLQALANPRADIRDDRLILCGHLSSAGTASYTYLARAVSPGVYVIPPVRAECMYDIGINSLYGGGRKLIVVPVAKVPVALSRAAESESR